MKQHLSATEVLMLHLTPRLIQVFIIVAHEQGAAPKSEDWMLLVRKKLMTSFIYPNQEG